MRAPRPLRLLLVLPLLLLAACTAGPDGEDDDEPYRWPELAPGQRWQPPPGTGWQWQLTGRLDTSVKAPVYDVDGFNTTKEQVAVLKKAGRKTICYLSTGAWEDWRPDAEAFPRDLLGKGNGWEGERWLDIRRTAELEPLMAKRFDMCRDKGFDAVEPDNMDGYQNPSGFPLTADDQLHYNRLIAKLAHDRGMAVGLKNDLDQIPQLVGDFDFAVNEQCAQYEECERLTPFVEAGKAVFHAEYELSPSRFCERSRELGLSSLRKRYDLDAWRKTCP
ncbi:endo alpha-1,4 polygalactosaminidase [Streptomyces sp. NRRL F-4428]|uniref:endo alpha-1,4 polygalactosaminidase n=1 Tax=Streptomyces sp. NRRL F-4428 TaxID=1609137 RepID=UPI0005ECB4B3|nr:endo alpha-1,4 polygalactosaminidase [Streptomyces sp. NRRL F-4428]KJK47052.1 endo alpha-1,4 polygalactosaminidase [Streptomyces sp. NRRL F-4428]